MPVIGVLGQGAVGRAVAARLSACGLDVRAADRDDRHTVLGARPDLLVLALTRGTESLEQLTELTAPDGASPRMPRFVLDLTTQSPDSAGRCARAAAAGGAVYHGGGLTGGGRELAAGRAVLLLGTPPDPGSLAATVVSMLGRSIGFPDAEAAAQAKLLHNWVLIVQQWAAALALRTVGTDGVPTLVEVFASGTAGRPPAQWSVVRDATGPACSTYLGRLVAKDLGEITRGLPELAAAAAPVLGLLETALAHGSDRPYTEAFLTIPDAGDGAKEAQ